MASEALVDAAAIAEAELRIRPFIRETALERSHRLSRDLGATIDLKLEQTQHTGSFKARGALNALLSLDRAARARGVATASSGNHGAAMAYGMHTLGVGGVIFVPEGASPAKVAAIEALGVEVQHYGDDCLLTELHAQRYAEQHGLTYISPYNDARVIAGQGTVGAEIARQAEHVDVAFVAVGGGGLIGGVATALRARWPQIEVVGCQPERSPVMAESVRAGRIVELPDLPTLSDGTAGGVEQGAITFPLCQRLVDRFVLVGEEEIAAAMRLVIEAHHTLIEGAAGVAVAGMLRCAGELRGRRAVAVLCGGNVSLATLRAVLA